MIKKIIVIAAILTVVCTIAAEPQSVKASIVPVFGMIDQGLKVFIKRATGEAEASGAGIILYEIDTYGGELEAAFEISDIIAGVPDSVLTVAYVKTKAISAGALISLSCNQLVMKENTTIGDCAPIVQSQEGPKMLGEKIQSPLRAKFRSLAKKNNYPSLLAEAMVSMNIEVMEILRDSVRQLVSRTEYNDLSEEEKKDIKQKRTLVSKGELLTIDAVEALELKFASHVVKSIDEVLDVYGMKRPVSRMEIVWSEKMVRIIRMIAPILMLIGLAGIGLEVKSPGLIWPAVIGVFCLALVFGGQYLAGMANYIEVILFIAGIVLVFVEVNIIPGFGVTGVAGILLVIISFVLSFQNFVIPSPAIPWQMQTFQRNLLRVALSMLGSFVLFIVLGKLVVSTTGFQRLVLSNTQGSGDGYLEKHPELSDLVGVTGRTITILRPSGSAELNGKRYDVITDGEFISKGQEIKVVRLDGSKIMVDHV